MANRYSSLNRRPAASAAASIFSDYPGSRPSPSSTPAPASFARSGSPYANANANGHAVGGDPSLGPNAAHSGFRPATPNARGQYSATVLEELEAQNDTTATTLLSQKVGQLKQLTLAIGDEIRDSSALADTVNEQFEGAGRRLRGTMRRMLRMAERTGVGWRVWLAFFVAVWLLFAWVWLF